MGMKVMSYRPTMAYIIISYSKNQEIRALLIPGVGFMWEEGVLLRTIYLIIFLKDPLIRALALGGVNTHNCYFTTQDSKNPLHPDLYT